MDMISRLTSQKAVQGLVPRDYRDHQLINLADSTIRFSPIKRLINNNMERYIARLRSDQQAIPKWIRHYIETEMTVASFRGDQQALLETHPVIPFFTVCGGRCRIISSAHGLLEHVLICYPQAGEHDYAEIFANLVQKLPSTTKFTIFAHPHVEEHVKEIMSDSKIPQARWSLIHSDEDMFEFTHWIADPFVVLHDLAASPPAICLYKPFDYYRWGDSVIAERIRHATKASGYPLHIDNDTSLLFFQGGNILAGDDFILMGVDQLNDSYSFIVGEHPLDSQLYPPEDLRPFLKELYLDMFDCSRELYKHLYIIKAKGPKYCSSDPLFGIVGDNQPIFHIDMFLSLAGRDSQGNYQILVGSPKLAAKILKHPLPDPLLAKPFDIVARKLRCKGFRVIRNPLPLVHDGESWYFATSNNCLVQIGEKREVWLPTYGDDESWQDLRAVDKENKRIWEEVLHFEVHELTNYHLLAKNRGAVHCITNVLQRSTLLNGGTLEPSP